MSKQIQKRIYLSHKQLDKLGNLKVKSGDTISAIIGRAIESYQFSPSGDEVNKNVRLILSVLNSLEIQPTQKTKVIKSLIGELIWMI